MPITFDTQKIAAYSKEFPTIEDFEKESCSVCLGSFSPFKENALLLTHQGIGSGKHAAHVECLTPWIEKEHKCPTCRQENLLPMRKEALLIFKKVTLNGLGSGLLLGALSYLNNVAFRLAREIEPEPFYAGNNIVFAAALTGSLVQLFLTCQGKPNNFFDEQRVFLSLAWGATTAMLTDSPPIAIFSAGASILSNIATVALLKAGASSQGLMPPMIVLTGVSAITSNLHIPIPTIPFAFLSSCLGSIGALKNGL